MDPIAAAGRRERVSERQSEAGMEHGRGIEIGQQQDIESRGGQRLVNGK